MKQKPSSRRRRSSTKSILHLPDLEHAKAAVLNSLNSADAKRGYRHAIDEFVDWYCSEPRLAFNRIVVLRYRSHLESRQLAPGTINLRRWRIVISPMIRWNFPSCYDSVMRDLVVLFIHFIASLARLLGPGGARSLVAESLLLKHQLLILNRSRQRAPNLSASDRIFAGWRSGCVPLACFDLPLC